MKTFLPVIFFILFPLVNTIAQPNYDESKVPPYTLPPLLVAGNGQAISTSEDWFNIRRPELIKLFTEQVYGKVPDHKIDVSFKVISDKKGALEGRANRKEIEMTFSGNGKTLPAVLLIYLPSHAPGPVPVFLGCNFDGNQTVFPDPDILMNPNWVANNPLLDISDNKSNEMTRGSSAERYPILHILSRGYGFATLYYGDIDPDYDDGFRNGIHPLFYEPGQTRPAKDEWGSIAAWSWSLSRAMDYLITDPAVDPEKVIVFGHSRLGKTALWAGALDTRFAMVVSNESGCGGAALSMRIFGETVATINKAFPHWFCENFKPYNNHEEKLPVDQHMLLALIAPRALYVCSAANDLWADPRGEFLSLYYASEIYHHLGKGGLTNDRMPEVNHPILAGNTGYHIRSGDHDLTFYDWERFMDFADKTLK